MDDVTDWMDLNAEDFDLDLLEFAEEDDAQMGMMAAADVYDAAFAAGLRPDPTVTVSEWADKHRILTTKTSSSPGLWRTSRTPYLEKIMDCLSPSFPFQKVVLMKGSQTGGSEAGNNWIGFIISSAPGPILLVQPTAKAGEGYSKNRIDDMIGASEILNKLVQPPRSRDSGNTLLLKEFQGGYLKIVGAESSVELRSNPIRYVFFDEMDAYGADSGNEGDPVSLALRRTANFPNRKIFMVSTPLIKGYSRIEFEFELSDKRFYWVPCPHCQQKQVLRWAQVKFDEGQREHAWYECIHCGEAISEHQKTWMLANGEWIAEQPDRKIAGFHLSALYSPWTSWGDIAVEHGKAGRDPVLLKVWVNTFLGESWEEDAETLSGDDLLDRRETFGTLLPAGIVLLTASVDVQDDRLEMEVVGWGRDEESWSVDYRVVYGDPSGPAVWEDMDVLLRRSYPHFRCVPDLKIRAACVDTGGHHTLSAYDFVRNKQDRRVWGIKGKGGPGIKLWPSKPSRNNKGRIPLYIVGIDAAKDAIYSRLRIQVPGPGYFHFPKDRDAEWFRQLTAEKIRTRFVRGRPIREWFKKSGDRNEALDCRVYAMAALHGLMASGLQINREAEKLEEIPLKKPGTDNPIIKKSARQVRTVKSSWMSR